MVLTESPSLTKQKLALAAAACCLLALLLATGYWKYKHRVRVDEFGHVITPEPGGGRVTPVPGTTIEDAAARAKLPATQDVAATPVAELAPALPAQVSGDDWTRSQGDAASSRYSSLKQIDRSNVSQLQIAWTYHSNDGNANIQCTPVIVDGVLYAPTAGNFVVALDAGTGQERWRFKPGGHPAQRGMIYWRDPATGKARLFFTSGAFLFALDPKAGILATEFGDGGKVPSGGVVSPVITQGVLAVANFNVVNGFNPLSGQKLWSFSVLAPPSGEANPSDRGANVWGGMAADTNRGIIYAATGAPHPNFLGLDHLGDNAHANSVIALASQTGKLLWSFQEVRHDIRDLDLPAPPNLVSIVHDGKRVDAVAQVTKLGNTLLLDRVTGKPLFPYQLKRAPTSRLPGERTAPYQPVFPLPEPFTRQEFHPSDVTALSRQATAFVDRQV